MKKYLTYFGVGFAIFLIISIIVFCVARQNEKELEEQRIIEQQEVYKAVDDILKTDKSYDISENDKITLAFSSETETVATIKNYLKDNKIAVFYVYGGPFDAKMEGNYIICTGFDNAGMTKIYYANDNYSKEYSYSFESMLEFAHKAITFDM